MASGGGVALGGGAGSAVFDAAGGGGAGSSWRCTVASGVTSGDRNIAAIARFPAARCSDITRRASSAVRGTRCEPASEPAVSRRPTAAVVLSRSSPVPCLAVARSCAPATSRTVRRGAQVSTTPGVAVGDDVSAPLGTPRVAYTGAWSSIRQLRAGGWLSQRSATRSERSVCEAASSHRLRRWRGSSTRS